ncbi:toxin-antitoxin system YwqK family antitoxin [Reichenbachiella carrageenanivorans]|uniref:Toxin-antitoxin system YwqK family antitoxin n=1 Tax=Reichenbachiella carrageenanivorans TaxID=2979869 RepID=A0ABY6CVI2_9BACT|nr:toxin-antitoxin system YwqK family antitoxin [Reichenbachiella carrageenanivorans]UXX77917.1 toxin-antitoxin system YwqK family antitoxin [Reichenbachiella carrageenanivorans]
MRYCWLLIVALGLWACDWSSYDQSQARLAYVITDEELFEDDVRLSRSVDGYTYLDSVRYTGYLISYYPDARLKSKKGYYDGKLEGDYITYYPSGEVYSQRPYHKGEKHGEHLGYFEDGGLKFQYQFVDGLGEGTHKEWYESGEPKLEMNYVKGHELGAQKYWRPDGKLRSNYVVRENGRRYGMLGLKRCAKIDSETGDIDPYKGTIQ